MFVKILVLVLDVVMLFLSGNLTIQHKKAGKKEWWIDFIITVLLVVAILNGIRNF